MVDFINVGADPRVCPKKGRDRALPLQKWMICGIFKTELRIFSRNIKNLYFHIGRQRTIKQRYLIFLFPCPCLLLLRLFADRVA